MRPARQPSRYVIARTRTSSRRAPGNCSMWTVAGGSISTHGFVTWPPPAPRTGHALPFAEPGPGVVGVAGQAKATAGVVLGEAVQLAVPRDRKRVRRYLGEDGRAQRPMQALDEAAEQRVPYA
jgi:hypothetical protein